MLQSVAIFPGLGKTHLAVGLARKAAEAGYRTYFTTAADLAARCHLCTVIQGEDGGVIAGEDVRA